MRSSTTLSVGDQAPDFSLTDVEGVTRSLSQHRGKKVLLSFCRYASCPFSNYAIDQLQNRHKKLVWAEKLDVIAIFQSPTESIEKFILKSRDNTSMEFPFLLLSDEEQATYRTYEVGESAIGFARGMSAYHWHSKRYAKYPTPNSGEYVVEGPATRLPSDFLIDEDGIVIDMFRARAINEHIPLERIEKFFCTCPPVPPLSVGSQAPDFSLTDVEGVMHSLSQHRGRKVLLSFYRYASCPFCNYAIDQLQGRYKKLAWAAKLDVIAVFQSPTESIDEFILKSRDNTSAEFPFLLLSDQDQATYWKYQVEEHAMGLVGNATGIATFYRHRKRYSKYVSPFTVVEGSPTRLPSDFLIDEDGIVVDLFRAKEIYEHIPLERIETFLMGMRGAVVTNEKCESTKEESTMKSN